MNYLNRPIFPFQIDWSTAIQRSVTYDLRETAIGFGAEYFTGTARYDVTGWEFGLHHETPQEILQFEWFADQLVGRLNGFWLPCPLQAAKFVTGFTNQVIAIEDEGLSQVWDKRPDQFLLFTFPDGTQAPAQMADVGTGDASGTWTADLDLPLDDLDPQYEYIVLKQALPQVPAAGTVITRLHYVRFAQDVEEMAFQCEGVAQMNITVVELPLEYTNAETGLQPIYLYDFSMKAPVNVHWRYTSFAAPVASGGNIFAPWAMTHKEIKQTTDGNSNPVTIEARPDPNHPLAILGGMPPGAVLWITIMRCYLATPNEAVNLFVGFVTEAPDTGDKLTATCNSRLQWLKTKLPRFYIGTICNWVLYDGNTCGVAPAPFTTTVTIVTVVPGQLPQIQVTFNFGFQLENWQTKNWFQGGTLQVGVGVNYELRSIVRSIWVPPAGETPGYLLLTLSAPLIKNGVGAFCEIAAGCDHTANGQNGCTPKFNNFANFGGFVDVPDNNLSLEGIDTSNAMGGKKG